VALSEVGQALSTARIQVFGSVVLESAALRTEFLLGCSHFFLQIGQGLPMAVQNRSHVLWVVALIVRQVVSAIKNGIFSDRACVGGTLNFPVY
jgi:hypothetical protein